MKVNDLMIGDWIHIKGQTEPSRITRIDGNNSICTNNYGLWDIEDVEPTPITKDFLETNGMKPFDVDKLTEKATAKWWAKGGDFYIKQYHFKHNDFVATYSFGCHPHTLIERLEFVHELQHALRLCGIEKDLVL